MIEALKPYAEYKKTGQDWLGELPAHWGLRRAKYLFREIDERSQTGKEELMSVSHITGVTPRSQKTVTMFLAESNVGYKVCRPDDVVINTLWAWMAALGVASQTGIVSPAYGVYRPLETDCFLPRYSDLLLRTPAYAAEYRRRSTGVNSSKLRLYPDQFLRIPLIYPPTDEQAAIVRFLDHANQKIDRFIRTKRRLIGLLNEQKQVIINHAVTKGLDLDMPMKDSGIELLGKMPEHWKVIRLKFIAKVNMGQSPVSEECNMDGLGTPFLQGNAEFGTRNPTPKLFCSTAKKHSYQKDFLLSVRAPVGALNIADQEYGIGRGLCAITPDIEQLEHAYAWYLLHVVRNGLNIVATGSTYDAVTTGQVGSMNCILPSIPEQHAIVSFLDRETAKLDTLIAYNRDVIEKLREFRTRLISDVVTGKLDVRGAELPAMEEAEVLEDIEIGEDTEAQELIESEEVANADN